MVMARAEFDATDDNGNLLTNVTVEVRLESTNALVSLYSDRDGTIALGNPYLVADGKVAFHVAGGSYKITMTAGSFTRILRYKGIGLAAESDVGRNPDTIKPIEQGVTGDGDGNGGGTDDTANLQTIFDDLNANDVLDGLGLWYRIDSTITWPNVNHITVSNMKFDFSNGVAGDTFLNNVFAYGADNALTADVAKGGLVIALTSVAGFVAGDTLKLQDTRLWTSGGSYYSEYVTIESISGNNVTVFDHIRYDYTTANSAKVQKMVLTHGMTFKNCDFVGSGVGNSQSGIVFTGVKDLLFTRCRFKNFDDRALMITELKNVAVWDCEFDSGQMAGFGYAITAGSGETIVVGRCNFHDFRHGTAFGGSSGILHDIKKLHNSGSGATAQLLDCHPATDGTLISGNYLKVGTTGSDQSAIITQGINNLIVDNWITGANGDAAIFHQPSTLEDNGDVTVIARNIIKGVATTGIGIFVHINQAGSSESVKIEGNTIIGGSVGVSIDCDGGSLNSWSISNNTIRDTLGRAVYAFSRAGRTLKNGVMVGNQLQQTANATETVLLYCATPTNLANTTVSGNTIINGTYGVRTIGTDFTLINSNVIQGQSAGKTLLGGTNETQSNNL